MEWKIYYSDGTYSSDQGPPESVSPYDVQVIVQPDNNQSVGNVGCLLLRLHDWYYYRTDSKEWAGGDLHGILDLFMAREPIVALCQGRRIPVNQFNAIYERAKDDPDFPRKSAATRIETP